jgi:hypothetical protein
VEVLAPFFVHQTSTYTSESQHRGPKLILKVTAMRRSLFHDTCNVF